MAKKKNQSKKHKFKYSEPTSDMAVRAQGSAPASTTATSATSPVSGSRPVVAAAASTRDFSYVFGDLKRITVLLVSLVALELVLWYLFGHTGLGDAVHSMIHI